MPEREPLRGARHRDEVVEPAPMAVRDDARLDRDVDPAEARRPVVAVGPELGDRRRLDRARRGRRPRIGREAGADRRRGGVVGEERRAVGPGPYDLRGHRGAAQSEPRTVDGSGCGQEDAVGRRSRRPSRCGLFVFALTRNQLADVPRAGVPPRTPWRPSSRSPAWHSRPRGRRCRCRCRRRPRRDDRGPRPTASPRQEERAASGGRGEARERAPGEVRRRE